MGKINQGNQKIARGHGNQGDHAPSARPKDDDGNDIDPGELDHHKDHNEAVRRRKKMRKQAASARRAVKNKRWSKKRIP